jgi:FkbM family methyltransferase
MLELGSFWAYYSLWFKKAVPDGTCFLIEPDPHYLEVGRRNFAINGMDGRFRNLSIGASSSPPKHFKCESDGIERPIPCVSVDDFLATEAIDRVDVLLADIQGAELEMLRGSTRSIENNRIRFALISTHHHSMSGDPLMHQRCRDFVLERGGTILAEHSVAESFSGDGLIAVSFDTTNCHLAPIPISYNRASHSLFREQEYDLQAAWTRIHELQSKLGDADSKRRPNWLRRLLAQAGWAES